MKYIKFIILTTFISCQNNTPKHAESEYAFENMAYKNLDLNKLNNKDSINQIGSINNENSIRKTKQNDSKIDKRSRDSLNRISQYNKDVWINLKEFYQTPSYLPSSKFDHLKHLRKYSTIEHLDEKTNKPKFFVDYVIERHLENPEHVKFLTDRKLLKKLRNVMCDEGYVRIADFLENGKHISITLRSDNLEVENHKITVDEKNNYISEIDGKYPFGAIYYSKSTDEIVELSQIKIQIEGNNLETRIEEYKNLYNPNFCHFGQHKRIAEAYQDGNNIYIYLFGGINAGSYFSKLIFEIDKGYIGKIVTDYFPLSIHGSFHEKFVGY